MRESAEILWSARFLVEWRNEMWCGSYFYAGISSEEHPEQHLESLRLGVVLTALLGHHGLTSGDGVRLYQLVGNI